MEPPVVRSRGRPRKRRNNDLQDVGDVPESCKRTIGSKPVALVGRYLLKEFRGSGKFLGKVVFYEEGLYRVIYEDGDSEDLESGEIRGLLFGDPCFDDGLSNRKKRLDELAARSPSTKSTKVLGKNVADLTKKEDQVEASLPSNLNSEHAIENDTGEIDVDVDSSSDSSEAVQDRFSEFEVESLLIPPPPLPPSSGTIGIPEQHVSHLFSVYCFLRSFSIRLFLYPFNLDDFVGSLNCGVANSLLDAIHVALMRAIRRHLEILSSDGSEVASKCLRYLNWSLLDSLTWPVFLVEYLTVMGYAKGMEWNGFCKSAFNNEYYSIPSSQKLMVLQFLCDEVLDSVELRSEIDSREVCEVGPDYDAGATYMFENGPRRVHPRYPKTSACKDEEAMEIIVKNQGIKSYTDQNFLGLKGGSNGGLDATAIDANINSDECRLCGMDGSLLCCDGCPSAYHFRCIGMGKTLIPQGPWYCPECSINKTQPARTNESSLRGAEIFGIDSHEQIFLGSCNYLLVLKASVNSEPCLKYYSQNDILKVLRVLCSSSQYIALYYGICRAIMRFWDVPENLLILPETSQMDVLPSNMRKDANFSTGSVPAGKEEYMDLAVVEEKKDATTCKSEEENEGVPYLNTSLHVEISRDLPGDHSGTMSVEYVGKSILPNGWKTDPITSNFSISKLANSTDIPCPDVVDISTTTDLLSNAGSNNFSHSWNGNDTSLPLNLSHQIKRSNISGHGKVKGHVNSAIGCAYTGSLYKPQAYVNHYLHGEFAASAAGKLEILSSEETRGLETHASDTKKSSSAYAVLQAKAFSLTASRFFWPTFDKKFTEVPRERCGWCLSCKSSVLCKKGCLLNHAALTATKGAMKILSSLRIGKNKEGNLSCIAVYILYMEESLHGLVCGPFLSTSYRKKWRHQLELASSCSSIKYLLLELEENIRSITLSGNWFKPVDDWFLEPSRNQNAPCVVGTIHKRGPGGRRNRKQSIVSEVSSKDPSDANFVWFRERLSKHVFQRAVLPRSMVARAARQGGSRKIFGICYTDGSEIPKRSKQFVWRAAVEASKNASQLALQVRNLDFHLRWSDLVRPEQTLQDAKGQETESSIFRNAIISDKKVVENKTTYGVAFGSQKHLPSRVMKNVIEIEQKEDGKDKYWFSENCIPLYLIKEYEESLNEVNLSSALGHQIFLFQSRRRQLKDFQREIFFYLTCKRDNMGLFSCSSCQTEVLIRNAMKCSSCQGYCHENCTVRSTISAVGDAIFPITCMQCHFKALSHCENSTESPNSPLPLQRKEHRNLATVRKSVKPKGFNQPSAPVNNKNSRSEMKQGTSSKSNQASKSRKKNCSWGITWKKKNSEDTGVNFRLNYLLLKGGLESHHLEPICHLCSMPYRSDLMYICCEACKNWYHAEAVKLEESKIFDVASFKCCRCRRIKTPECPYMDPNHKKQESRKSRVRTSKQESSEVECELLTGSEYKKLEASSPLLLGEEDSGQDPLLFSLAKVELITEPNSGLDDDWNLAGGQAPQKLPVRRLTKQEEDADGFSEGSLSHSLSSTYYDSNSLLKPMERSSSPFSEWNNSTHGLEGETMFDYESLTYEDMDFEPQTYFSFTELLAPDDAEFGGVDPSRDGSGDVENSAFTTTHNDIPNHCSSGQLEPVESLPAVNCQICSNTEPIPDLSCDICGLQIHSYCSPWGDGITVEHKWSCGRCREWK